MSGAFFCVNMVLITLSSFLSATIINLYMRADKKNKVPDWLRMVRWCMLLGYCDATNNNSSSSSSRYTVLVMSMYVAATMVRPTKHDTQSTEWWFSLRTLRSWHNLQSSAHVAGSPCLSNGQPCQVVFPRGSGYKEELASNGFSNGIRQQTTTVQGVYK